MPDPVNPDKPTVLIVEDDTIIASALRMLFERRGWSASMASTIRQAQSLLDPPPQWIIADLMLPDGDGAELLRDVRERGLPIKVVIVTGVHDPERVKAAKELKPDAFLHKPVSFNQLLSALGMSTDT